MPKKGEKLSEQAAERMRESKRKRMLSKYNWIITEPYLDVEIDNGSSNRKKTHLNLREFKSHIEDGLSVKEIKSKGVSKHLLQFFSNFCQGKIKLIRDDFMKDYQEGISLDEISEKYNVKRDDLTFLRQLYEIKRKGATFINRKKTEVPFTQRQKDILYGSMMGDAKRQNAKWNSIAGFQQGNKQKVYLLWKFSEFASVCNETTLKFSPSSDTREAYKNSSGMWSFYTKANISVEECLREFYKSGKKEVSNKILENLSPLSIAVWAMDDGYAEFTRGKGKLYNFIFCTDSFSKESCANIAHWFKEKYNINSHLRERKLNKKGVMMYRIVVKSDSIPTFLSLVEPHIIPSMKYKVDYKEYVRKRSKK